MTILILHGIEGRAGIHWQGWLAEDLTKAGHEVIMPTLPDADHPDRMIWLERVEELIGGVEPGELVIVAHSLGAVTALDLMEQMRIKAFVSVSGFARDYGVELNSYFLQEREIDFDRVNANVGKAFVIYGDNDPYVPPAALQLLADRLDVKPEIIKNGGHFNTAAGYTTFPRLLEIMKQKF